MRPLVKRRVEGSSVTKETSEVWVAIAPHRIYTVLSCVEPIDIPWKPPKGLRVYHFQHLR